MKITRKQLRKIINEEIQKEGFFDFFRRGSQEEEVLGSEVENEKKKPSLDWIELTPTLFKAREVKNPLFKRHLRGGVDVFISYDMLKKGWNLSIKNALVDHDRPFLYLKRVGEDAEQAKDYAFNLLQSKDGRPPEWEWRNTEAWEALYMSYR